MQRLRLVSPLPIIRRPCDACLFGEDDPQNLAARHAPRWVMDRPDLKTVRHWIYHVSLVRRVDSRETNAVMSAPDQRDVLCVRPAKRHRRTGWTTGFHSCAWQVRSIPNLFGKHAAFI